MYIVPPNGITSTLAFHHAEHTNSGDHSQTDPLLGGMVNGGGLQLDMGLLAKSRETIDLISEKAVRIEDSCPLDSLFASDEEDEGQEVSAPVISYLQ